MCTLSKDNRETVAFGLLMALLAEHPGKPQPARAEVDLIFYAEQAIPVAIRLYRPCSGGVCGGSFFKSITLRRDMTLSFENIAGEWVLKDPEDIEHERSAIAARVSALPRANETEPSAAPGGGGAVSVSLV